jgi:hypothetical protein
MQATITKEIGMNGKGTSWKVEIGFGHVVFFPITTAKSTLIQYAITNGAEGVKFFINE